MNKGKKGGRGERKELGNFKGKVQLYIDYH